MAGAGVVGVGGSLLGDLWAGECGLLSSLASLAATGSRGTSVRGGCAFFRGGSSDSDLSSSVGRRRDFFISSLSCSNSCSARSSSTLMTSGFTDCVRSRDLERLLLWRLSRSLVRSRSLSRSLPPSLSLARSRSRFRFRSRLRLRLRLQLRPRPPRLRVGRRWANSASMRFSRARSSSRILRRRSSRVASCSSLSFFARARSSSSSFSMRSLFFRRRSSSSFSCASRALRRSSFIS